MLGESKRYLFIVYLYMLFIRILVNVLNKTSYNLPPGTECYEWQGNNKIYNCNIIFIKKMCVCMYVKFNSTYRIEHNGFGTQRV